MPTNKTINELLTEYFLKQDPKEIAKALAGCMVDFNRLCYFGELGETERESLMKRIEVIIEELHKFLKNPEKASKEPFSVEIMNSDE